MEEYWDLINKAYIYNTEQIEQSVRSYGNMVCRNLQAHSIVVVRVARPPIVTGCPRVCVQVAKKARLTEHVGQSTWNS